jgi:FG-GAP-like repeat
MLTVTASVSVRAIFRRITRGDFNGDGYADLVWQHADGTLALWTMQGRARNESLPLLPQLTVVGLNRDRSDDPAATAVFLSPQSRILDLDWQIVATPDLDGNGMADLIWQHATTGQVAAWHMDGAIRLRGEFLTPDGIDPSWHVRAAADIDGDRKPDLVWQHAGTGALRVWFMDGTTRMAESALAPGQAPSPWRLVGASDLDRDGHVDLVFEHPTTGDVYVWLMTGTSIATQVAIGRIGATWHVRSVGDLDADGHTDIVWQGAGGELVVWFMHGTTIASAMSLTPGVVEPGWKIVGGR